MGYYEGHLLDADFQARVAFCGEVEGLNRGVVLDMMPKIAASPGFADAYAYALATGVENPGRDEAVISDAQILAAVQAAAPVG